MARRKFLFLQGMATPFFRELSKAIHNKGHETFRVNFCGGDTLFSIGTMSWRFNHNIEQLPKWLAKKHQEYRFTDAILFGDTRPVHKETIKLLRDRGVRLHVFEEGYLRPNFITLESNGVNGYSNLIGKSTSFWRETPEETEYPFAPEIGKTFGARAINDMKYRVANALLKPLFTNYQSHRPANALLEYAGWAKRMPTIKFWYSGKDNHTIQQLVTANKHFYLFPLQLDSDSQIKVHSPYFSIEQAIEEVLGSFAQYAPKESLLVVKNHPLATGLINHRQQVMQYADTLDIRQRILFLECGHLPTLLRSTAGTVLINSTTGTSALYHGSPTCVLGTAIYNMPGLTFQHGINRFWKEGQPADKNLYHNFRRLLIKHTQINGDFYSKRGITMAVEGSLARMDIDLVKTPVTDIKPLELTPLTVPSGYGGKLPENSYQYKKR